MKNLATNSSGDGAGCAALDLAMIFLVAHNGCQARTIISTTLYSLSLNI